MREEVIKEAAQLFELVQTVPPENPNKLFAEHLKIREVLAKISAEQDPFLRNKDRSTKLEAFLEWAKTANIKMDNVEIRKSEKGFGLFAKTDLAKDGYAVEVPRPAVMTPDSNRINKGLRELFLTDRLIQSVENCPMVLLLAHEVLDPKSAWKPYLDMLPDDVGGPLSMSNEDLLALKPSSTFIVALQFFRCIVRHYVYFLLMINTRENTKHVTKAGGDSMRKTVFTVKNFSFEMYAWCTSIVTSRVNKIPNLIQNSKRTITSPALIPVMDFANYEFIGDANAAQTEDCLIYSGFVPAIENPINFFELRLGFPKNTQPWKIILAQRMRMLGPREMGTTFPVHPSTFHSHQLNDIAFWRFAKLFVANSDSDINRRSNVIKARDFLLQRFQLFLESFKDLPPTEPEGTLTVKSVWRLKNAEKKILEDLVKYFQQPVEEVIKSNGPVLDDEPILSNTEV
uniref:Protein-histidine N-methyltransferase n=1 Tax=Panagrolaimus sp. JU765 TaxID=591449 RepID=A0AC34R262_9BILA